MSPLQPSSHFYDSGGLHLHYLLWGDSTKPPLLLVHGGRDQAHIWDRLASELCQDYAVYVPDLRGHGDSDWTSASQYGFPEFVADLAALVAVIHQSRGTAEQLTLIGHSRGGGIVIRYAGTFPEQVTRVVAIDGIGRNTRWDVPAPQRLRGWIQNRLDADRRQPRIYANLESASERVMEANPRFGRELAIHLAQHGTREVDGGLIWKFDPRVLPHPASDFNDDEMRLFFAAITAPVLFVRGDASVRGEPHQDEWAGAFPNATSVILPGVGHWVHHERPDELLGLVREFLSAPAVAGD